MTTPTRARMPEDRDAHWVFIDGHYRRRRHARLAMEDRAVMFGDGVYEVMRLIDGRIPLLDAHVARLARSMHALELPATARVLDLPAITRTLAVRNRLRDAVIYWQVSRGVQPRDFVYQQGLDPTVLVMMQPATPLSENAMPAAWKVTVMADQRWARCDIKTTMLLPASLATTQARRQGYDGVLFERDGFLLEGASYNLFAVHDGVLWTPPATQAILHGVTRAMVMQISHLQGITIREAPLPRQVALEADELFVTGTTTLVTPVAEVDGQGIGKKTFMPLGTRLRGLLIERLCKKSVSPVIK